VREPRREDAGERVAEHREPPEPGRLHRGDQVARQVGDPVAGGRGELRDVTIKQHKTAAIHGALVIGAIK
jgi:hypothetical protein